MSFLNLEAINRFTETVNENDRVIANRIAYKLATGQAIEEFERDKHTLDGVSMGDIREAALCLAILLNTSEDVRKILGISGKRGPKGSTTLDDNTIQSEEFGIVCALASGEIKSPKAVSMLVDKFGVSKRTAKRFIENRLDAAKNYLAVRDSILRITGQN